MSSSPSYSAAVHSSNSSSSSPSWDVFRRRALHPSRTWLGNHSLGTCRNVLPFAFSEERQCGQPLGAISSQWLLQSHSGKGQIALTLLLTAPVGSHTEVRGEKEDREGKESPIRMELTICCSLILDGIFISEGLAHFLTLTCFSIKIASKQANKRKSVSFWKESLSAQIPAYMSTQWVMDFFLEKRHKIPRPLSEKGMAKPKCGRFGVRAREHSTVLSSRISFSLTASPF